MSVLATNWGSYFFAGERRVIVSHCKKHARKVRPVREKAVNKLPEKLNGSQRPKVLMSYCGYKLFARMQDSSRVLVSPNKIEQAQQWDGLHGVVANVPTMPDDHALSNCRGLWQVEQSFRITKHDHEDAADLSLDARRTEFRRISLFRS